MTTRSAFAVARLDAVVGGVGRAAPGALLTFLVAGAALALAAPLGISSIPIALLLGMMLAGVTGHERWSAGIGFSARSVLRIGVALLGAQITFGQIAGLGVAPVLITVAALVVSLVAGVAIARALGLPTEMAVLTASAVSICGASAALAVASALPRSRSLDHSSAVAIASITLVGTGAMLVYPLAARQLGLSDISAGLFLGASLHEVVQAVGGGFAFSGLAGETATTVKLIRVACLAPVVVAIGYAFSARAPGHDGTPPPVPLFLIGFLVMVGAASFNLFGPVATNALGHASRYFLTMAMVALGLKISLLPLVRAGGRAVLIVTAQSLLLAAIALGAVLLV